MKWNERSKCLRTARCWLINNKRFNQQSNGQFVMIRQNSPGRINSLNWWLLWDFHRLNRWWDLNWMCCPSLSFLFTTVVSGGKKIFSVRFYLYTLSFCTHIYYTNKLQILNLDPTRAKYKFSVISLFTLIRSFTVPRLGRRKKKKMKMNQRKRGGVT